MSLMDKMLLLVLIEKNSSLPIINKSTTNVTSLSSGQIFESDLNNFPNMQWTKLVIVAIFIILVLITIIGNTLVILSISTTKRLRTVTNCFIMNLAITDLLVGVLVMPPAITVHVFGTWRFGWIFCDIWISLDILLCTGSILSLCAISLDRYLAVIQPLTYSKKRRSKRLALYMILIVWLMALLITCPPFLGWYETERWKHGYSVCRYNRNKGYVVFSAMGSFFIPLTIMLYVYLKIGFILKSRRQQILRDAVSERDCDNFLIEMEQFKCIGSKCQHCQNSRTHQTTIVQISRVTHCSAATAPAASNCKCIGTKNQRKENTEIIRSSTVPAIRQLPPIHIAEHRSSSLSESRLSSVKFNLIRNQDEQRNLQQPNIFRIPMRVSSRKKDSKTAKTLSIVIGGFIACWLPFFVYYILIPFLPEKFISTSLMSILTWIGWVNCTINPFIYAFYNRDFRASFWRLTFHKLRRRPINRKSLFRG